VTALAIGVGALMIPIVVLAVAIGSIVRPFDVSHTVALVSVPVGTMVDALGWSRYASTALLTVPVLVTRQ
jgi:hypothetical protein